MIKKYRSKEILEVMQFTGDNYEEINDFVCPRKCEFIKNDGEDPFLQLSIPEGSIIFPLNNYIIKGENYSCSIEALTKRLEGYEEIKE